MVLKLIVTAVKHKLLYYLFQGCYEAGKEFISDFTAALIGMGVGVGAFIVSGGFNA